MFRFTRKPSSGSHSQYLAKITHLVKSRYVRGRTGRCQCYGCILWPVRRVYCALYEGIQYTLTTSYTNPTYPLW